MQFRNIIVLALSLNLVYIVLRIWTLIRPYFKYYLEIKQFIGDIYADIRTDTSMA